MISVDDLAFLVDDDQSVGVAVEGDADGGAALDDLGANVIRVECAGVAC